jgi:hypothetical protein
MNSFKCKTSGNSNLKQWYALNVCCNNYLSLILTFVSSWGSYWKRINCRWRIGGNATNCKIVSLINWETFCKLPWLLFLLAACPNHRRHTSCRLQEFRARYSRGMTRWLKKGILCLWIYSKIKNFPTKYLILARFLITNTQVTFTQIIF